MGRKSRMKKERRKAEEYLNKPQQESVDLSSERSNTNGEVMKQDPLEFMRILDECGELLTEVFNREGEKGLRKHYKEFGPPAVALNSRGEIIPAGWAIKEGSIVFFVTRLMVSDGNGGFMCRDCQRGYFECLCSAENNPPSVCLA